MLDITIREITPANYSQLEDFLYHAIFIPAGEEYPPRKIIFEPEIYVYIKDFGLNTDCGVVAELNGNLVGAAWTRIIPAYGHLDESTPELAISILPDYRGQGIGTLLMNRLFELLRERDYKRTSLSVQQNNPAVRFYERLGYRVTDEKVDHAGHDDFIMVKNLLENTKLFSGKAEAYAKARPGYPEEAIEYIASLVPANAVFADIGAGTGKFTECLARRGFKVFAIEPNADMREQLAVTLNPYPNAEIVAGTAEVTTIPNNSVDVITCAQALHWFDPGAFRTECRRIGKSGVLVIAVYNNTPGGSSTTHSKLSTDTFFINPIVCEFPNPIFYTREKWLEYMTSHSHDPLPSDPRYNAHIAEMNVIFDCENMDGLLKRDVITKVYSERVEI